MAILKHADFEVPGFGEFAAPPVAVPAYTDAVLAFSPTAYWRMSESVGPTLADQTAAHPLTLTGAYVLSQAGAIKTDTDAALHLTGGTASTSGAVFPAVASSPFTLAFWIRSPGTIADIWPFMGQYNSSNLGSSLFTLYADGRVGYRIVGHPGLFTSAAVSSQWTMLTLTRSTTGNLQWYVNGQPDTQSTGDSNAFLNISLRIGNITYKAPNIVLDELAIFGSELSAQEVRWLYGLASAQLQLPPHS